MLAMNQYFNQRKNGNLLKISRQPLTLHVAMAHHLVMMMPWMIQKALVRFCQQLVSPLAWTREEVR